MDSPAPFETRTGAVGRSLDWDDISVQQIEESVKINTCAHIESADFRR